MGWIRGRNDQPIDSNLFEFEIRARESKICEIN